MAAREHRVSRRALLGAAVLSLVEGAAHPEPVEGRAFSSQAWNRALARFRGAEARLTSLEHEPDEDLYDNANAVFFHALKKLVRTPAPDLRVYPERLLAGSRRALSLKIDLTVDHEVAELTGGTACLAALKSDARRLAPSLRPS